MSPPSSDIVADRASQERTMAFEKAGASARPIDEPATTKIPPEGGLAGWLCVVGSTTGLFCTFGFLAAYVPIVFRRLSPISEQSLTTKNLAALGYSNPPTKRPSSTHTLPQIYHGSSPFSSRSCGSSVPFLAVSQTHTVPHPSSSLAASSASFLCAC